jgi:hypothetical protein
MNDQEPCPSALPSDFVYDRATQSWRIAKPCPGATPERYGVWQRYANLEDGYFVRNAIDMTVAPWSGTHEEALRYAEHFNSGPADPGWDVALKGPRNVVRAYHNPQACRCWGVWCTTGEPNDGPHWAIEGVHGNGRWGQVVRGSYEAMADIAVRMRCTATARQFEVAVGRGEPAPSPPYAQIMGRLQRAGSPPAAVVTYCADCKVGPCDCHEAVWTYAFRRPGVKTHLNTLWRRDYESEGKDRFVGFTRAEAIDLLEKKCLPGYEYGPLQRLSEPVHVFGTEKPTDVCHIAGCRVHTTCKLRWCGRPAAYDTHCSDRCRAYDEKRQAIERQARDFLIRMHRRSDGADIQCLPPIDFAAELRWAHDKREDEMAEIERQFRSLQPEA